MKQFLLTSCFALFLFSCTKKETPPLTPNSIVGYSISDYTKLTVGNYWIYEIMNVDTLGHATLEEIDSCYISKDSVVNGNTYAVVVDASPTSINIQLERDSTYCLVNQQGAILFAYGDFNAVLVKDTIPDTASTKYSVSSIPSIIAVPMGTFTCYNYKGTNISYILHRTRYTDAYYSLNAGMVELVTGLYDDSNTIQYWLLRSHVR